MAAGPEHVPGPESGFGRVHGQASPPLVLVPTGSDPRALCYMLAATTALALTTRRQEDCHAEGGARRPCKSTRREDSALTSRRRRRHDSTVRVAGIAVSEHADAVL